MVLTTALSMIGTIATGEFINKSINALFWLFTVYQHFDFTWSNGWESNNCEAAWPFICEVEAGMVAPTTAAPPTIPPPLPCNEENNGDGWIKPSGDDQFCYKFTLSAGEISKTVLKT